MSEKTSQEQAQARSPVARILVNIGWLLGGKGFAAVCSIIYLMILTRTLGLKGFGHFSLIVGTAQALASFAGFQTWRVVVRYGVPHVHRKEWDKFGRLVMFCAAMDAVGAICGCLIAYVVIYGFGKSLSLNPAYVDTAFYYCCAALWALTSAMTGVMRAINRFDAMIYVESIPPVTRLIAALLIWWTGPSVERFLAAWVTIALVEAVAYWVMARKLTPRGFRFSQMLDIKQTVAENPGIGSFMAVTYGSSTLDATMQHGPLLAVGAFTGTRQAGLYRLASQLTQSLSKLSALLTRAVYPEVTRTRALSDFRSFRNLALRISLAAGLVGTVVVTIALLAGRQLLALIGGRAFEQGAIILVPLAIVASLDLASVAFEPVLHATGRARLALMARLLAVMAFGLGLWAMIGIGPSGAAWSVALGATVSYLAMAIMAYVTLRRVAHEERASTTSTADQAELS